MKVGGIFLFGVLAASALSLLSISIRERTFNLVEVFAREAEAIVEETGEVTLFAAGDMFFDRRIRQIGEARGEDFIFSCISDLIKKADFAVANLEGPITIYPSRSVGSIVGSPDNFVFTFPTTTATLLARHNFRVVGLGNNHILNFGYGGLQSTQWFLSQAGVGFFGGVEGDESVFYTRENGVELAFVGYNEFGGSSPKNVANLILEEKKAGRVVIVYAHWGDEYVDATPRLQPVAELFADSGAAVIIGAHPHVVLKSEYIGDTLVYYSLGNFIFDQYWNKDVSHGLTLLLHVKKDGIAWAEEHHTQMWRDGQICPVLELKTI